jgi:hypothetical protein
MSLRLRGCVTARMRHCEERSRKRKQETRNIEHGTRNVEVAGRFCSIFTGVTASGARHCERSPSLRAEPVTASGAKQEAGNKEYGTRITELSMYSFFCSLFLVRYSNKYRSFSYTCGHASFVNHCLVRPYATGIAVGG